MQKKIHIQLESLGLTGNEAKCYTALLTLGTANGYAVARQSGIPSSKIYQVLSSLMEKGFAVSDGLDKPQYQPVPAGEALGRVKQHTLSAIHDLIPALKQMSSRQESLNARFLKGRFQVESSLHQLIGSARSQLLITAWPQELSRLKPHLTAVPKKTNVFVLSYGDFKIARAEIYRHRRTDLVKQEIPGRSLLAVSGASQAVAARWNGDGTPEGMEINNPALAAIIRDHILHDISLNLAMSLIPETLERKVEKQLTRLRKRL